MIEKKYCVVGSIIIYGFSIAFFFILNKRHSFAYCDWSEPCIRFCCFEKASCNDKFVKENFNISVIPERRESDEQEFRYLLGNPACIFKKKIDANEFQKSWSFSFVSLSIYFALSKDLHFEVVDRTVMFG